MCPMIPDEGTTFGSMERGTESSSSSSSSQSPVWILNIRVRLALEGSVAWTAPLVKFQMSHESTVPNSRSPASACSRAPGTFSEPSGLSCRKNRRRARAPSSPRTGGLPLFAQAVTEARSTPVLPDDGVVYGRAGPAVPDDGGLALVGDAHRRDFRTRNPRLPKALGRNHRLAVEKFVGVVLHPAGLRIVLREFLLAI